MTILLCFTLSGFIPYKLAGSLENAIVREEPAKVEPARVEGNLPELKETCIDYNSKLEHGCLYRDLHG